MSRELPRCPWCEWTAVYAESDGDDALSNQSRRSNDADRARHLLHCEVGQLRDRFAMAALSGMMSTADISLVRAPSSDDAQRLVAESGEVDKARAHHAFRLADAMLAAREGKS